jgi:hypothetical protein
MEGPAGGFQRRLPLPTVRGLFCFIQPGGAKYNDPTDLGGLPMMTATRPSYWCSPACRQAWNMAGRLKRLPLQLFENRGNHGKGVGGRGGKARGKEKEA